MVTVVVVAVVIDGAGSCSSCGSFGDDGAVVVVAVVIDDAGSCGSCGSFGD